MSSMTSMSATEHLLHSHRPGLEALRVLSASGQLGYGIPAEALARGMESRPHFMGCDMGSIDPGPYYLGSGEMATPASMVHRDLTLVLLAARQAHIPLIIGSAGTAGAQPHLDATVAIVLQIALGGWVSTNYAVLACPDFPTCNGQWVPEMNWQGFSLWRELGYTPQGELLPFLALSTIHFVHRSAAWLVLGVMVWVGWQLRQQEGLSVAGRWLLGLSALQLITGLSNVVLGWPLLAAVLHTGGAAAMVVTLTWALSVSRTDNPQRMTFSPRPAP